MCPVHVSTQILYTYILYVGLSQLNSFVNRCIYCADNSNTLSALKAILSQIIFYPTYIEEKRDSQVFILGCTYV